MPCGRRLDVGVVEDDHRRLAAQLEVDPLEVGLAADVGDLHAGAHRAGDGDHLRDRVLHERAPGVAVTGDHVEDTRRQELLAQLGEEGRASPGVVSLGLRTMVLPAASAGAIFQTIIISG